MISVTRLNGKRFYINAELIQMIETTPDTVITLTNDNKLIVRETAAEIAELIVSYQRKVRQPLSEDNQEKSSQ
jgi:flagellar protein FlbD